MLRRGGLAGPRQTYAGRGGPGYYGLPWWMG